MLGLTKGIVKLLPHDENWHLLFAEESARLREAAGTYLAAIEHVGSTAICGISAKPIIDIAAAVEKISDAEKFIAPIENIGYRYRGENGIPNRHYFVKGEPERTHHLHVVELRGEIWRNHLLFRNFLRQNPKAVAAYEKLKRELAQKHETDREAYTAGKAEFIENILRLAGAKEI